MKLVDWLIIGAGPAGIATVGKLIDNGVPANQIAWLDPVFNVGDLGNKWFNVSSNTSVELFLKFLHESPAFAFANCPEAYYLQHLPMDATCELKWVVEPLRWVTARLSETVQPIRGIAHRLWLTHRQWHIQLDNEVICAKQVVMAIGALPKIIPYPAPSMIPLESALNLERLPLACGPSDTVAVFGSSHSAVIAIRHLLACGVQKIINFHRGALRYAVPMDNWTLFDNTGLKGDTARWARAVLDGDCPESILRFWASHENIEQYLPECTKIIYSIGFTRRQLPVTGLDVLSYDDKCGIIAPGLFGCGIAFPESIVDPFGHVEANVGLWKFMTYLTKVVPVWLKYGA